MFLFNCHQEKQKSHHPQFINAAKITLRFLHPAPILCFETSTLWAHIFASKSPNPHTECQISKNALLKIQRKTDMKLSEYPMGLRTMTQFSSVTQSCPTLQPHGLQHTRPPCPSLSSPRVYSNSWPLSRWCHPTISSSVDPFSSHLQSFPASGSFPMSQFFTSCSQSIGASASVLPMNIQDWFPLGWTGWIALQSKGLSRVFSNTTVQKHQFFGAQLCL